MLTGVGFLNDDDILLAPSDEALSYLEAPAEGLDSHYLNYNMDTWTFAFHNACWKLLLDQLSTLEVSPLRESDQIGQHLFNFLHCLPSDRHTVSFPAHDFGGARQFWTSPTRIADSWTFLLAEPNISCFAPSQRIHQPSAVYSPWVSQFAALVESQDPFVRQPQEVMFMVVDEVSSLDLCNLRLVSRSIASVRCPKR